MCTLFSLSLSLSISLYTIPKRLCTRSKIPCSAVRISVLICLHVSTLNTHRHIASAKYVHGQFIRDGERKNIIQDKYLFQESLLCTQGSAGFFRREASPSIVSSFTDSLRNALFHIFHIVYESLYLFETFNLQYALFSTVKVFQCEFVAFI